MASWREAWAAAALDHEDECQGHEEDYYFGWLAAQVEAEGETT